MQMEHPEANFSINSDQDDGISHRPGEQQLQQPINTNAQGIQEVLSDNLVPETFQIQHNQQFQFCKRKCEHREIPFGCPCIDGILACFKEPICEFDTKT